MFVLGKAFHLSIESLPSCCLQDPLTRGCFGKVGDCKNAGRKSSGDERGSLSGVRESSLEDLWVGSLGC